jgi:hypothetical protein
MLGLANADKFIVCLPPFKFGISWWFIAADEKR